MRSLELPRIRIAGLLVITFWIALYAMVVRYWGILSVPIVYMLAPTILAAGSGLFEWPQSFRPLKFIRGALVFVWGISMAFPIWVSLLAGAGPGISVFCCHAAITLLVWGPQYFLVTNFYK